MSAKERPILMQADMVCATRRDDEPKTQTRRRLKLQPAEVHPIPERDSYPMSGRFEVVDGVGWGVVDYTMGEQEAFVCPYGVPGDRLWVRESFFVDDYRYYPHGRLPKERGDIHDLLYRADGTCCKQLGECACEGKGSVWRPSIHMPRWASRITLEIVAVRIEQVQQITEEDAWAEGCKRGEAWSSGKGYFPAEEPHPKGGWIGWDFAKDWYADLWDSINGEDAWEKNEWVWVVEFKRVV